MLPGSSPKNIDVIERAPLKVQERCSLFKTIEDFEKLKKVVDRSKSIAIIGGGFLGSELACALSKYGNFIPFLQNHKHCNYLIRVYVD